MEKAASSTPYMESETFRSLPQAVIDRLMSHQTRFTNMKMTEESIDDIILRAATGSLDLDLSGSQLTGEAPYFVLDSLSRNEYVNFVHVNLSSSNINAGGFSVLMDYFVYFNALETLNVRNNHLPKEAGVAIAKILGAHAPLKMLDASGNCLSDAGIAAIAGAFTADLSRLSATSLLGHPTDGPRRQVSLLSLAVLDLSRNNFGDGGLLALCRGLTHFLKAALQARGGGAAGSAPLVSLRVLRLGHNKCGDKAAACLAQFLETFYRPGLLPLQELALGQNPLGHTGVLAILRAVQTQSYIQQQQQQQQQQQAHPPHTPTLATPSLVRLCLAECGCGSLDVLEEAAQVFAGNNLQDLDLTMSDDDAQHLCSSPMFVDTVVSLADAVTQARRPVTALRLGNLAAVARKEAAGMLPGSTAFYALRVALDSFESIRESVRVGNRRVVYQHQQPHPHQEQKHQEQHQFSLPRSGRGVGGGSASPSNVSVSSHSVTALQLQQEDFEQLRREHSTAFQELSHEISRIPDLELQSSLQAALDNINVNEINVNGTHARQAPQQQQQQQGVPTSALFTQAQLAGLVENAVTSALATARQQWERDGAKGSGSGSGSGGLGAGAEDLLQHVVSRVDVLQEQMQALDAQAFSLASTSQCEELNRLAIQLETRIARLESRLDHLELGTARNHSDTQVAVAEDKENTTLRFEQLLARMTALESSVEAEHETSLDLLDLLLLQKQHPHPHPHQHPQKQLQLQQQQSEASEQRGSGHGASRSGRQQASHAHSNGGSAHPQQQGHHEEGGEGGGRSMQHRRR